MSTTLKDRIIAMKRANPKLWPADIARELGCRREYARRTLAEQDAEKSEPVPVGVTSHDPKATGSGRRHVSGYLRLM